MRNMHSDQNPAPVLVRSLLADTFQPGRYAHWIGSMQPTRQRGSHISCDASHKFPPESAVQKDEHTSEQASAPGELLDGSRRQKLSVQCLQSANQGIALPARAISSWVLMRDYIQITNKTNNRAINSPSRQVRRRERYDGRKTNLTQNLIRSGKGSSSRLGLSERTSQFVRRR